MLKTRIEGGSPPDMAALAQPTGVLAYAAEGKVKDIAAIVGPMDTAKLKAEFPSTIGLTSDGDHIWSIPTKADVKSMIWYPVKAFAAKGYTVPKTWDELVALSDKIVADGSHPFCVSAGGPGTATGWELTDWVEEVLLKTEDPQVTNDWVSGKIKFTDPKIKAAFDKVGSLLFKDRLRRRRWPGHRERRPQDRHGSDVQPGHGRARLLDAEDPRLVRPGLLPGSSRTSGGDSKYTIGDDGDIGIFPFPTISDTFKGAEGSADSFMVLDDRPEVRAFAEFLATPEGLEGWIKSVGVLSPNVKVPAEWYAGNYKLKVANDIASARNRDRFRRLGPDAPGRRPGQLLDRHLRLGQQQRHEHRFGAAGHRRQLAQVGRHIVIVARSRGAPPPVGAPLLFRQRPRRGEVAVDRTHESGSYGTSRTVLVASLIGLLLAAIGITVLIDRAGRSEAPRLDLRPARQCRGRRGPAERAGRSILREAPARGHRAARRRRAGSGSCSRP